jgi:hypothetical protein
MSGPERAFAVGWLTKGPALTYSVVGFVVFAALIGGLFYLSLGTARTEYTATFSETGLPAGSTWSVNLNGTNETSVVTGGAGSINFSEPDGLYPYTIATNASYSPVPSQGLLLVKAQSVRLNVTFYFHGNPIGASFGVGSPILETCPTGSTFVAQGCTSGDYAYTVVIEFSAVYFDNVRLAVVTSAGANYSVSPSGGFSVLAVNASVAAQTSSAQMGGVLAMPTSWQSYAAGTHPSTPLVTTYSIVIDVGTADPTGMGLILQVYGNQGYSGLISLALP